MTPAIAESPAAAAPPGQTTPRADRVVSIDAFHGFVMTLMLAEVMRLPGLAKAFPESGLASFLASHTSHVAWQGASLHDLIQPGFTFLAGASLPFSLAARAARGQPAARMFLHAVGRSLILVFLGIFLRSMNRPRPTSHSKTR